MTRDYGETWDTKVWWVHPEALYALALAACLAEDAELWSEFETLQTYVRAHFYDPEYGEWYKYLHRDGAVKGDSVKAAFHVPRALMYLVLLFDRMVVDSHCAVP